MIGVGISFAVRLFTDALRSIVLRGAVHVDTGYALREYLMAVF
jgi:hypothetical protein